MSLKPLLHIAAMAAAAVMVLSAGAAGAGGTATIAPINFGTTSAGPKCHTSGGGGVTIYKPINIYKPVTIDNDVNIWKNVDIQNNVNIWKNIDINNDITINKNIDITNNININKNITINNSASASAEAFAFAAAGANASAGTIIFAGSNYEETVINKGEESLGEIQASAACEMQTATVVKAIHAVCVSAEGREFPASHMTNETWIDSSYEGEVARCIPGASVKVTVGDVVQSDQGMAGAYEHGTVFRCAEHEALRHYKNGMLKCAPVVPVKDCTERTNLRKFGTGDFFFSYRSQVCATSAHEAQAQALELTGMHLDGGVGP